MPKSMFGQVCMALMSTVQRVTVDVINFVRRCRSARADLAEVTRELSELQMVLDLVVDYGTQGGQNRPAATGLRSHLTPIVANCITVLLLVSDVLRRHGEGNGPPRWTVEGRDEIFELQKALCVHRGVMGLASDLISMLTSDAADDGNELQASKIVAQLQVLRLSIIINDRNTTLSRQHHALQVHLGQIITYAQALLGKSETPRDAIKALDEAPKESLHESYGGIRTCLPVTAPLKGRMSYEDGAFDHLGLPDRSLENLVPRAKRKDRTLDSSDSLTINCIRTPVAMTCTNTGESHGIAGRRRPGSRSAPRMSLGNAASEGLINSREKGNPLGVVELSAAQLPEVEISTEKEVAFFNDSGRRMDISDEALTFTQAPVHVLGRLSVNLVGHVHPNEPNRRMAAESADALSFRHSLSTIRTEDGGFGDDDDDDVASTGTSDTGSLRDGDLQFSQIDTDKLPRAPPRTTPYHGPLPASRSQPSVWQQQQPPPPPPGSAQAQWMTSSHLQTASGQLEIREAQSMSTMNTQAFYSQKALPRTPLMYIPGYPGPFVKKKAVVVGNFSCGKTCMISRMSRGRFPKEKSDKCGIIETVRVTVDDQPVELSLWDIRGIDYDPTWLHRADVALVCFSVNIGSTDPKGKHLGRWVAEVNRNCTGAAILLVGLKADMRGRGGGGGGGRALVTPEQGEAFRSSIGASRYVECSARTGDGVLDVLAETTRVALQVGGRDVDEDGRRRRRQRQRPLSRIGRFLGISGTSGRE